MTAPEIPPRRTIISAAAVSYSMVSGDETLGSGFMFLPCMKITHSGLLQIKPWYLTEGLSAIEIIPTRLVLMIFVFTDEKSIRLIHV